MGNIVTVIPFEILCIVYSVLFIVMLIISASSIILFVRSRIPLLIVSTAIWISTSYLMMTQLASVPITSDISRHKKPNADVSQVTITFQTPVDFRKLKIHSFPNDNLTINHYGYLNNIFPFGRKITVTWNVILPPAEHVMVYISDISGPFTFGYGGEHLYEFETENPTIIATNPVDTSRDVLNTQSMTFTFNAPIGLESEWSVESQPQHTMFVEQSDEKTLTLKPSIPFRQGTTYTITLNHRGITRNIHNGEIIDKTNIRTIKTTTFTTVKPPFISKFEPQGDVVSPVEEIKITFDEAMNKESVQQSFKISPNVSTSMQWSSDKRMLTLVHDPFEKNTLYTVTFKKGLTTESRGVMESDTTLYFKTAGPLNLVTSIPEDRSSHISVNTPISLFFNQNVHTSSTNTIYIEPYVPLTTTATNNTITLTPSIPLLFDTTYTITIPENTEAEFGLPSLKKYQLSFTTSPDEIILPVPYYKQQAQFTCNIAAARMLLAFRGIMVDEETLIKNIGNGGKRGSGNPYLGYIDDYGTYWNALEKGVQRYRPYKIITNGKLSDITHEINKGNPVMIWGQNGWSDPHQLSWTTADNIYVNAINGMHSSVVTGFRGVENNPTHIFLNDPWRGKYNIETKEFMRRWNFFNVALVVY